MSSFNIIVGKGMKPYRGTPRQYALEVCGLLGLTLITRWPLAPKHLFYFDSVNFALALKEFNPALHQPQPPGYPLFVGLSRLLNLLIAAPEQVFLTAGILGTAVAAFFLLRLGERMSGYWSGVFAALLFLLHPVAWFGGLTNQVRIFLSVASCGTAYLAWRAWTPKSAPGWFYGAAAYLGIVSGFRPDSLLLLVPLLAATAWRRRASAAQLWTAAALLAAPVAAWSWVLVYSVGGIPAYIRLIAGYSSVEFSRSSALFGASLKSAIRMAESAAVFHLVGSPRWIWALPVAALRRNWPDLRDCRGFLAIWFVPGFLFSALVHVADPDQSLLTVPVACLLGGILTFKAIELRGAPLPEWRAAATAAVALVIGVFLFLHPLRGHARAVSYQVVQRVDRQTRATIQSLEAMAAEGPLRIIAYDSFVTWRHLAFYFPQSEILVIESGSPGQPPAVHYAGRENRTLELPPGRRLELGPASRLAILLPPPGRGIRRMLKKQIDFEENGPVASCTPHPGQEFELANLRFHIRE